MRIINNHNLQQQSFKAIYFNEQTGKRIQELFTDDKTFRTNYEKLEEYAQDQDIYIQTIKNRGLSFALVDTFTHEAQYYLSSDNSPWAALKKAIDKLEEIKTTGMDVFNLSPENDTVESVTQEPGTTQNAELAEQGKQAGQDKQNETPGLLRTLFEIGLQKLINSNTMDQDKK